MRTRKRELDEHDLWFWLRWLNDYTDHEIYLFDRELCRDESEIEDFGLSALPRLEMARIMRVLELNLTPRKSTDSFAPTAYGLKHVVESYIRKEEGRRFYYVSELQAASIMRILGYQRTHDKPRRYNVSMRSYHKLLDKLHDMSEGK